MRTALTSSLTAFALSFASCSTAFAASGTLDQAGLTFDSVTQILAGLLTLGLLYVVKTKRQQVLKLGAPRQHHTARGLFDD